MLLSLLIALLHEVNEGYKVLVHDLSVVVDQHPVIQNHVRLFVTHTCTTDSAQIDPQLILLVVEHLLGTFPSLYSELFFSLSVQQIAFEHFLTLLALGICDCKVFVKVKDAFPGATVSTKQLTLSFNLVLDEVADVPDVGPTLPCILTFAVLEAV